jgi:hypothetical protein
MTEPERAVVEATRAYCRAVRAVWAQDEAARPPPPAAWQGAGAPMLARYWALFDAVDALERQGE